MKKIVIVMILSLLTFSSIAYGEEQTVDSDIVEMIEVEVELTNERIEDYIDLHIGYSEYVIASYNEEIDFINEHYSNDMKQSMIHIATEKKDYLIDQIIDSLIKVTNAEAERMFKRAESVGVTVVCEYTVVIIDNKEVLIDPIRVVGG